MAALLGFGAVRERRVATAIGCGSSTGTGNDFGGTQMNEARPEGHR